MEKTILGLDLGTTSIGWALVKEGENAAIIKMGVRVIPLSTDEIQNFDKGKSITTNADRTLKRAARRNLQRYKLRRENLIEVLSAHKLITAETVLAETGNRSTFETYCNRSKAAEEKIELSEFARVLLMINKKRGYKSSRKVKNESDGQAIDGMTIALKLYNEQLTPGQLVHARFLEGIMNVPDFYRSDLQNEFRTIWKFQACFYPEHLTDEHLEVLTGKSSKETKDFFKKRGDEWEVPGKNGSEKKKSRYAVRAKAVSEQVTLGELGELLADINSALKSSSGYLGAISDRSKKLYFNKQTVGQFQYRQIEENAHARLKGQVFYRQDYLDEFNTIWEKQQQFYPAALTEELKNEVRDIVIFYQRRLKSQKGLLSTCEFESKPVEVMIEGKKKQKLTGPKVCPKSSPLFQEFKIRAQLNNVELRSPDGKTSIRFLEPEEIQALFEAASWTDSLTETKALEIIGFKGHRLNFEKLDGNRTNAAILNGFISYIHQSGHDDIDWKKVPQLETVISILQSLQIDTSIFEFNSALEAKALTEQASYQFWHLLYSYEEDDTNSEIERLNRLLVSRYNIAEELAHVIAGITFTDDYSTLSTKAILKILPHLKEHNKYDYACFLAGYNHSHSETKADLDKKVYKELLEILPKNSLRNPVVEKIINQMVHVVNGVIAAYGKPDEIRLEMARELKKTAKQRETATTAIAAATRDHESFRVILREEFGLSHVSRNDLVRYKLYKELEPNGYKTLYSNTYISKEKLFSADFDIEHIIPQSVLFDDSFSNKTLELRSVNGKKDKATAFDFVQSEYGDEGMKQYLGRIESICGNGANRSKRRKLEMTALEIPKDFINRDLNDTQYIAKKAKELLSGIVRTVGITTGSITARLREDWQLIDVLKELNWDKYHALEMTEEIENRHGQKLSRIKDWTKRNDHRHHAMDALTVAFTKPAHIQYLNNLNARSEKNVIIYAIQKSETAIDENGKRRFKSPMPLKEFRAAAKEHLEQTLVSFKAKNKVSTKNKNTTKTKTGKKTVIAETPRGQLHLETVYGSSLAYVTKLEKVGASFNEEKIAKVASKKQRELLLKRLEAFGGDPKKAFTGTNSLAKNPIYLDELQTHVLPESVKLVGQEQRYTIRKDITKDLKIDKVLDAGVRTILQQRLAEFNGDASKAFSNLEKNPIYLNKSQGIVLKKVTISGVNNAIPLHDKRDQFGTKILDENGDTIPVDFVNTGNNHHIAVYRDEKGNLQEEVVSLFEAVTRKNQQQPIIKKMHEKGWEFLFTMKQNEYFVFPNEKTGFNPKEIDLFDVNNFKTISPNLYRVQKLTTRDYYFRHHLETSVEDKRELENMSYKRIRSLGPIMSAIKIRLNHIGLIVQTGE